MMMDYITIAGYTFAVFGAEIAVGKLVEKSEILDRKAKISIYVKTTASKFPNHYDRFDY